jgi:DNA-binding NarL/FixJ family response regulator
VDDHARLRELYKHALRNESGLQVVGEAADGEQAVAAARACRPDLIVLDLSMPRTDGLQALQSLKRVAPQARVLVLSGFMRERVEGLVRGMGANAYAEKGLPAHELAPLLLKVADEPPCAPGPDMMLSELEQRARDLI